MQPFTHHPLRLVFNLGLTALLVAGCALAPSPSPAAPPPETPAATATPEAATPEALGEYMQRLAALGFTGAALVAQGGEVVLAEGYGLVDRAGQERITAETIFNIGSNTKPFTAAAILKLRDQGLVNLDDTVADFFPDAPGDKAGITVHQLLTHSSGLSHGGTFEGDLEAVSREEAGRRILASELLFPPGQESSYSDLGYILLAAIVEVASGQTYPAYVRAQLLEPAGMTSTGWWGADPALRGKPQATGYVQGEARGSGTDFPEPQWAIQGAGGMVSSVTDLWRWHQAVLNGGILSAEAAALYSQGHFALGPRENEGYGWMVGERLPGRQARSSAGGTPQLGHNSVIDWWLDDDLLVIVNSSDDAMKAEEVAPHLALRLFGLESALPPAVFAVDEAALDAFAGRYLLPSGGEIVIERTGDHLLATAAGQDGFDLLFTRSESGGLVFGPPPAEAQAAVVKYLNEAAGPQLAQWKENRSRELGEFQGIEVVGTAAPTGSGEPWTYVSFQFENGSVLTRWIVNSEGALQAALLETEPPQAPFWPRSATEFLAFSLGQPLSVQALEFDRGAGTVTIHSQESETVTAVRSQSE